MKKICLLLLSSIIVIVQKNYSQTLDQNVHEPMKKTDLCSVLLIMNESKIDWTGIRIDRRDCVMHMASKRYNSLWQNNKDTTEIRAEFPFNSAPVYSPVEGHYKWKWEQAMKGTIFSY